ncbi:TniQ family protein [Mycolicibacterium goodii]|uniref:TniQ family protein n=1 Tax=Mycolicibacterium goodii TaxID=134601 RepID=A0ABS6HZP8_MYCGD|nr:TniQ family protein [Mycolicibacterium goodii]MBU8840507.1 TniQ family protein [Mycolicibacterium goodii]
MPREPADRRTLPVSVKPLPGEAVNSWLAAMARHLDLPWASFLGFILPPQNRTECHRLCQRDLTGYLTAWELAAISAATGVQAEAIVAMTLAGSAAAATSGATPPGRKNAQWPFGRSRFCPKCLQTSGGRWQLQWRLPWICACATHTCLLSDTCPACGQLQRTAGHWLIGAHVPTPERCSAPAPNGQCCGAPLSEASTLPLPAGHRFLENQAQLSEILTGTTVKIGLYQRAPVSTAQFLADLRLLTFRTAETMDHESLLSVLDSASSEATLVEWHNDEQRCLTRLSESAQS